MSPQNHSGEISLYQRPPYVMHLQTVWRLYGDCMETHRFSVPADGDPSARQRRRQPRGPENGANRPASQQEVRAAEAYFVKFPIELFDVIPGIGSARIDVPLDPVETEVPEDFQSGQEGSGRAHHTCPRPQAASRG
jgi:hypothetical protein